MKAIRTIIMLSFLFAVACDAEPTINIDAVPQAQEQAIVHGHVCAAGCFPETGLLTLATMNRCTGTLIAPDVVLTAAHCVDFQVRGEPLPALFFGFSPEVPEGDDALSINANAYVIHPQWVGFDNVQREGPQDAHDLALIFLQEPFPADTPLATLQDGTLGEMMRLGSPAEVTGYGRRTDLQEDDTYTAATERIKHRGRTTVQGIGLGELVVGGGTDPHACNGDSGGPLFVYPDGEDAPVQAGVASRINNYQPALGCSTGVVYARIDTNLPWIEQTMEAACASGTRATCEVPRTASRRAFASGAAGCAEAPVTWWLLVALLGGFQLCRMGPRP